MNDDYVWYTFSFFSGWIKIDVATFCPQVSKQPLTHCRKVFIKWGATHQLLSRSMVGSTRRMKTELSSPLQETEWHFSVSAASWAPAPETPPLWREQNPFGWGWRCGRRAGSRRRCSASRWWWTSSLQLYRQTSSLRTDAWFQPSMNKSSSSSGSLAWAFGTFALF